MRNLQNRKVFVLGAGTMGAGIAQVAAQAGHEVVLFDALPGALDRAVETIRADLGTAVTRGKLRSEDAEAILGRLESATHLDAARGCGLVIEAVIEDLSVKQDLLRQVEKLLPEEAIVLSNTSSISVTAIASALKRPQRFAGWHFFNPATRMKLVEIVPGLQTEQEVVQTLQDLTHAWGKNAVVAPNMPGFIVNRVARPYYAEAWRLLAEDVCNAQTIDALMQQSGGFALGPFELMDLIGQDINLAVTWSVFQATGYDSRYLPSTAQQELVHAGLLGRKTGRGVYTWASGKAMRADIATVEPSSTPCTVRHAADMGLLGPLIDRLREAGVCVQCDADVAPSALFVGEYAVALSDGRTAAQRYQQDCTASDLALIDLCLDYAQTPLLGATSAKPSAALAELAAVLQPAGIKLVPLRDVAGLVVLRTVCALVNEALDLCSWTDVQPGDVDLAMKLGTAYPLGPLAWGQRIGADQVRTVLANLQTHYGDARYRHSPRLNHAYWTGEPLDV